MTQGDAVWLRVLAAMEDNARAALEGDETALSSASWRPPVGLPPLPPRFRARAQSVIATQQRAAAQLHERIAGVRAQLSAARANPSTGPSAPPVYLDTLG